MTPFRDALIATSGVFVVLSLAPAAWAQAASASPPVAPASGAVSEVVVTAAPYAVSAQSLTSHVDILTRQQLDTLPPTGLGDLLNGLPGVRSTAYGAGASRPVIRGLSGPRVLVLQNGIGQIDVSDVSPDHAVATDPAEASRIEVLRGPSTLLYGGSGIGGVVNVLDDRVASKKPKGIEGRFNASGSSVDQGYGVSGAARVGVGNWVVSVDGDRRESSDYDIPVPALSRRFVQANGVVPDPDRTLRNTATELTTYGGGVSYVGDWGFLGASVRRLDSTYGVPYPQILGEPPGGEGGPVFLELSQTRVDVRGELKLGGDIFERLKVSGGWAEYQHQEISRNSGAVNTTFLSDGEEGRIELVQKEHDGWQGAIGVNGLKRSFSALGGEAFVPSTDIARVGVFTLQRLDRGKWGLEGGLRVDHASLNTVVDDRFPILQAALNGASGATRDFTDVSGSIAAFYRPTAQWFLSLNYSHNARAPNEVELFANGPHGGTNAYEIGDPNLGSESVNSVEGTARYTGGRLRAEAHAYYASYSDFIEENATGAVIDGLPVFQFRPLAAEFFGTELEASYAVWRQEGRELRLEGAYDYVHGEGDGAPLSRIPPQSFTARVAYTSPRITARAEARHVGEQDRVTPFELPTDAYTTLNLFASYKPFETQGLRVYVDGRNLTDEEVREHVSFLKDIAPQPGRNIRVGVAYEF